MIRHLLKLVWNRKRSTGLLMAEIAVSFLVVFAVAAFALHSLANWRHPLGYDWENVWAIEIDTNIKSDDDWTAADSEGFRQLLAEARRLSRVSSAAGVFAIPYAFSTSQGPIRYGERSVDAMSNEVTDDLPAVLGLRIVAGRWFGPEDDAAARRPVVINQRLADELFGDEDPVGKVVEPPGPQDRNAEAVVIGIVDEFRQHGELVAPDNYVFRRVRTRPRAAAASATATTGTPAPEDRGDRPPRNLLLRVAPGTPGSYEQEVLDRLGKVVPAWSLEVQPLAAHRDRRLRLGMAPLLVGGTVGGFLLLMVALGLLGVLWQSVTRRTRELGLRRAVGASRRSIRRQVLLELLLITSLAIAPALVLVLQLPLLELIGSITPAVFAAAVVAALLLMYALCLGCALYPAAIATRLEPADALRWE